MEEKKAGRNKDTLWSFFGFWNYCGSFFWRSNHAVSHAFSFSNVKITKGYALSLSKGFTLIELLIVIAIIGVLAAGVLTVLNPFTQLQKARDATRKSDFLQIQKALEAYYNDNNSYPAADVFGRITGAPWGSPWPPYMTKVPQDPYGAYGGRGYKYKALPDGQTYYLYTSLERADDPQVCAVLPCPNSGGLPEDCDSGPGVCNYGATSTNTSP